MIGSWQISHLSDACRYREYASAYLKANIEVCKQMLENESERTWPNATVAFWLAAHSVELFLKGAILTRGF